MKVVVSGASGLIGTALVPHLRQRGHSVITLVRRDPRRTDEVRWDPAAGVIDSAGLHGVDGAVHLSGAGVADHRWTDAYRQVIRDSRVQSTSLLAGALATLKPAPRVLVSASGIDYYRPTPEPVTEDSAAGEGFLAEVCRAWEGASQPASDAGIAVSHLRTGLVLAQRGGVMGRLGPLVRLGLAGPLGSGRQWWSWITLPDQVAAITFLLERHIHGPINLTSPEPVQQVELMRALARAVKRPAVVPAPAVAIRLALGDFADTVLADRRILPGRLTDLGFTFTHPTIAVAAPWVMGRSSS